MSNFLGFRMRRLQNKLSRDFSVRTHSLGLRAGMFSSLEIITANPGISQSDLSLEVGLDKSAMVAMIDALEARGWVTRARSETDRRRYELVTTGAGRALLDGLFTEMDATEKVGLAALSEQERVIVRKALDKVYSAYVRSPKNTD